MAKTITSAIPTLSSILAVFDTVDIFTSSADILGIVVRSMYGERREYMPPKDVLQLMEKTFGNLGFRELDQKGREERSQKNALIQRIIMALFGGIALIGPMLIMTLH